MEESLNKCKEHVYAIWIPISFFSSLSLSASTASKSILRFTPSESHTAAETCSGAPRRTRPAAYAPTAPANTPAGGGGRG